MFQDTEHQRPVNGRAPKIYYEQRTRLYPFPERVGITSKKEYSRRSCITVLIE
uniref:Uncharacterized protein n=2 Tax=Enterobacteriaceae TaxID=543 RepID=A0A2Z2CFX6_ECOLX|nr:hypothetical protein [Escherichia coli]AWH57597.1 hypothetical protein [Escherichia coli]AYK27725.1 hypothetical protein [Klebsiella pneumoniae]QID23572.1 hypothetical protein [Escherichia coli]URN46199.1 hypothetical protein [Pseudocitrobacter faecalis]